ncbi:hypothetical protein SFC65_19520 [Priestia filamentosa]|uniref:hypothetical protein n=1 Tax=Priestia filamentosa TaxID=1402861 RepID=UPI003981B1F8
MELTEIEKMLSTLVEYEDSPITHTIPGLIELTYCKTSRTFKITIFPGEEVLTQSNLEVTCEFLYNILNSSEEGKNGSGA